MGRPVVCLIWSWKSRCNSQERAWRRQLDQANGSVEIGHESFGIPQADGREAQPSGTILLVEDESFVREVTRQVLELAGFRVIEARTAGDARKSFRRQPDKPDLLITDVVLPDRNGRELSQELSARRADLKTIFISGYPENAVNRTPPNGGTFFLAKPFSRDALLAVVRRALAEGSNDSC